MTLAADAPQVNGLYTHPNTHVRVDSGAPVTESWLNGHGALVLGGATAAGAAIVRALAEAGAYVTIADSNAHDGQRLMLELVGRNLRVQYIFTNLPVFRSQTEATHYAAVFSPTSTLSVIICAAIPPPILSRGSNLSILSWLRTTTTDSTFPNPLPAPSIAPLDRTITTTYHAVHLALHHFRQSPPLVPQQQQRSRMPQHHQNASSTFPLSHPTNHSPTSFKTVGTSTSAHAAPPVPSRPAPALPLDPSTALNAHPVFSSEDGETSTSPKCPTTPGSLLPPAAAPMPRSAEELILPSPSPSSSAGRALEASIQTFNLTADLPPNERKHLVILAPAKFLSEQNDDDDDDESHYDDETDGNEALGHGLRALRSLPPHHLAERAAAASLRAMVAALEELCETDAVGPGINVGCVPWDDECFDDTVIRNGEDGGVKATPAKGQGQGQAADGETTTADERCVKGVMRLLCGIKPTDASNDGDAAAARGDGLLDMDGSGSGGDIIIRQDDDVADFQADESTDVEADADDEASASASALDEDEDEDEDDSSSSSSTHSTPLKLAARSVASLDRPSPSASRIALPPALGQVREEDEEGEAMSPVLLQAEDKDGGAVSGLARNADGGKEEGRFGGDGKEQQRRRRRREKGEAGGDEVVRLGTRGMNPHTNTETGTSVTKPPRDEHSGGGSRGGAGRSSTKRGKGDSERENTMAVAAADEGEECSRRDRAGDAKMSDAKALGEMTSETTRAAVSMSSALEMEKEQKQEEKWNWNTQEKRGSISSTLSETF